MYHRAVGGLRESLADPVRRKRLVWGALAVLSWTALLLRWGIDAGGVLDVDVVNLGLAAERFDILDRQPQPPGYVGYVLLLKLLHLVAPGLDPIDVARWGARLCGAGTVLAAYWACRELLSDGELGQDARGRPLAAAALSAVHPLLWYYGADGQTHAAEALVTLLLVAVVLRARRRPSTPRLLLVVALFGIAGSLRPTIPLLSSPLLVWLFWRRPLRDWSLALVVGAASVAVWAAPAIALSGGWDLYQRAGRALVTDMFIANHSVFSARAPSTLVVANMVKTLWWSAVALIPIVAWSPGRGRPWTRVWKAVVAANVVFYATVYTAEAGYLAAVAALACLVPATWPAVARLGLRARIALVAIGAPAFLMVGPASVPVPDHPDADMPTLARAMDLQEVQLIYRTAVCGAAAGRPAVAITDNPANTHTRPIPVVCPNVAVALYVHSVPFDPGRVLDTWMIFFRDGLMAVPTGVPLEPGPAAHVQLPEPVERIILTPDLGPELKQLVLRQRACDPENYVDPGSGLRVMVLRARCLPALRTATHSIDFTAPARSGPDRFGGL